MVTSQLVNNGIVNALVKGRLSQIDRVAPPSIKLIKTSRAVRRFARVLLIGLIGSIALMSFAPWQQSISGNGSVAAFSPSERPQVIEAPIKGRIVAWGEGIIENARVTEGQFIAEIRDLDPDLITRLESQREFAEQAIAAVEGQLEANRRTLEAAQQVVATCESQVANYQQVKEEILAAADLAIDSAEQKVLAEEQYLAEQQAGLEQETANYERQQTLFEEGIVGADTFQVAERKYREALAKVARAELSLEAARLDLLSRQRSREASAHKAQTDIDYAMSLFQKSISDVAKAESDISKTQSELTKAQSDLIDAQIKLERQRSQVIVSPCDGIITSITPNLGTGLLSEGAPICTIVPASTVSIVQIWVDGNDAPLISPGRHVRLQFEGWPAVQFVGWPSVAVGTFGGEVMSIDATDDGKGKFRVLVRPTEGEEWPDSRYLRQGTRANGWILLDQVDLWFEVWRKINGFPPTVQQDVEIPKPPK